MRQKNTGHIFTVSKLTKQIKSLLEETYPFIWVTGEISNYSTPASGHSYFTLKDNQAVIQAVMFKNQKRGLKFLPENGLRVFGLARLSLYEPRGSYQLIFEHLEPEGLGSAQIAFEQLKSKLSANGLFDDRNKKKVPVLPSHVSVITSGTGAAVKDILHIAQRRYPNCPIDITQVQVQGDLSVDEICNAISFVNKQNISDVVILARGGGSFEDLAAFNSENVALAIFDSKIPLVTGIGHETDYTISDFVSDLRAPTPSAAAELVFPEIKNLAYTVKQFKLNLIQALNTRISIQKKRLESKTVRLRNPQRIMDDFRFRIEDNEKRLNQSLKNRHQYYKEKIAWLNDSLVNFHPHQKISRLKNHLAVLSSTLTQNIKTRHDIQRLRFSELNSKLNTLDPTAVLKRGYSIARRLDSQTVITTSEDVQNNDTIEVLLHQGRLITKVEQTHGQKKDI